MFILIFHFPSVDNLMEAVRCMNVENCFWVMKPIYFCIISFGCTICTRKLSKANKPCCLKVVYNFMHRSRRDSFRLNLVFFKKVKDIVSADYSQHDEESRQTVKSEIILKLKQYT